MESTMTAEQFEAHVGEMTMYDMDVEYCVTAINEEAGEIAGWHKKHNLRKNPTGQLTTLDLKGELGDVLFYIAAMSRIYGWTLSDIMIHNREKLLERRAKGMRSIA